MTSGALTAAMAGALGYALLAGLAVRAPADLGAALKVFGVAPEPPPPRPEPPRPRAKERSAKSGSPSPANIRSKATEVTAPTPVVPPLVVPPPIVVAPLPGVGVQASTGAAPVAGPGTGAGGVGNGSGTGGRGDGEGDGDGGYDRPARQKKGRLSLYGNRFPLGLHTSIEVKYLVDVDGRAKQCQVLRSSGEPVIDQVTCRSILDSFRFDPWRDPDGQAETGWLRSTYHWDLDPEAPERG